jgi:hypothetical protein
MGFLHIPLSGEIPLGELLSDMPARPKALIRKGFSVVAKLPESAHPALLKGTLTAAGQHKTLNEEQFAKELRISVEEATAAMAALGMFSALASARSETAEQLLQVMIDSDFVSSQDQSSLLRIVPKITQIKPEINKAVATNRLLSAVLPSFDDFEAVLDIRVGDEESGGFALPVAVAYLDTDARDQHLWFQLTREDVEKLQEKLNSLLKRFKEAEAIVAKWPSITGGA